MTAPPFGMSQAVLDTESSLVFVSGQVDWDRQYQVSQNSVSGQFEAALDNLRTALVAAGASVCDSLLHLRVYIRENLKSTWNLRRPNLGQVPWQPEQA